MATTLEERKAFLKKQYEKRYGKKKVKPDSYINIRGTKIPQRKRGSN